MQDLHTRPLRGDLWQNRLPRRSSLACLQARVAAVRLAFGFAKGLQMAILFCREPLGGPGFFLQQDLAVGGGDGGVEAFAGLLLERGQHLLGRVAVHAHFFALLNDG